MHPTARGMYHNSQMKKELPNKGMYKGSHRLEFCWGPILWPMIR